ncbi:MAG: hypothetical protein R2724_10540 [Bryobacterales bacterium]
MKSLVVTQIAATVLFTATAYVYRQAGYIAAVKTAFPTDQYLSVRLAMEPDGAAEESGRVYASASKKASKGDLRTKGRLWASRWREQLPLAATTNARAIEIGERGLGAIEPLDDGCCRRRAELFEVFQMPVLAYRTFDRGTCERTRIL